MPMMMYDEAAAPASVWSNAQGPMPFGSEGPYQQSGDMQMQQMEPRGSFMRQASSGGLNGVYGSSNQMQYF
ncbi:hypothetical protein STCU_10486 [Strigomonas culicis]|uniref:Uncharacterized protein n=1 Tax=Strigomonas culicis TaxID=28005 RepID=S9TMT2_9TRYP|nr:hypothetical protein STCU_10486 [Strigomonas culicis]|eukprot:EPY17658.1 hypothetical protein STCU_10486 [Strigomonas culicis]